MAKAKKAKKAKKAAPPKPLRVAFIGAGNRAKMAHYPSVRESPGVEICAVSELNEERMQTVAKQYRIKGLYTDYRKMIETEKPDVVYAIMPTYHLFDTAATVMDMGCNLVVEKPLSLTAEQARIMAVLARKNKVVTAVTLQRRFAPVIRTGKEMCEEVGPVHTAEAQFVKCALGSGPAGRGAIDLLTGDGVHAVDTLRYLCGGDVEAVAGDVRRLGGEHQTVFLAMVRFSSGATGFLKFGYQMGRRIFSVEAHSSGISLYADPEEGGNVYADNDVKPKKVLDPFKLSRSKKTHRAYGPFAMHQHILNCVREGKQPETNFEDSIKTMELVEAILTSDF